jgi:hypothetical protein
MKLINFSDDKLKKFNNSSSTNQNKKNKRKNLRFADDMRQYIENSNTKINKNFTPDGRSASEAMLLRSITPIKKVKAPSELIPICKKFCEHLAHGLNKSSFCYKIRYNTLMRYLRDQDFFITTEEKLLQIQLLNDIQNAYYDGKTFLEQKLIDGALGLVPNFNAQAMKFIMMNKFPEWRRENTLHIKKDNTSHTNISIDQRVEIVKQLELLGIKVSFDE